VRYEGAMYRHRGGELPIPGACFFPEGERGGTERKGAPKTLEVSRERAEQMSVVVDLGSTKRPENAVVFSTRGPLTIAEQEVEVPGEEAVEDPAS